MIFSDRTAITFQDKLPESVDVVIIGAGVIGISTALILAERGVSVLVCDKGRVAGEQSSRNWGWIRQQARDADELPIVIDSIGTWENWAKKSADIGFTRQGVLYLAKNASELAEYEKWLGIAQQHQVDTRMLSAAEVDTLVKDKPGQWAGGMYTPSDARAEPFNAVPALAQQLSNLGGLIRENCAVRGVETYAGNVSAVVTEHGRVKTNAVVCAAGAWSTMFMASLGVSLPQLSVRATVARTAPAPDIYTGNASVGEIAIRRRQDGGYTIASGNSNEHFINLDSFRYFFKFLPALAASARFIKLRVNAGIVKQLLPGSTFARSWRLDEVTPFEKTRVLNPAPSAAALAKMRKGLIHRLPTLGDIEFVEAWAGMIDVTPDVVPVMDEIMQYPGLFLATGFSGHGFGIGPGAGRVMADLVMGNSPAHNLHRFRMSRFSDGSKMRPGPGL